MDRKKLFVIYKLKEAIDKKDHGKVKELLQQEVDVNFKDANDSSNTLLHVAVSAGDLNIVRMLLDRGAKNVCNFNSETPLSLASKLENPGEIFTLLSNHFKDQSDPAEVAEPECKVNEITYERVLGQNSEQEAEYQALVEAYFFLRCQPHFKTGKINLSFEIKEAGSFKDIVLDFSSPVGSHLMFVQVVPYEGVNKSESCYNEIKLQKYFKDYLGIREYFSKLFNRNFSKSNVELIVFTSERFHACSEIENILEPFDMSETDFLKTKEEGKGFMFKNNETFAQKLLNITDERTTKICSKEGVSNATIATDFFKSLKIYCDQANETEMKHVLLKEISKIACEPDLDVNATFKNLYHKIVEYRAKEGTVHFLTEKCDYLEKAKTLTLIECRYSRRTGTSSISGPLYESKLLALALNRFMNLELDFYLGTNVNNIGQFDDLVIRYTDRDEKKKKYLFGQAKHHDNPNTKIITDDKVQNIKSNNEFNLLQNFNDYLQIREKFNPQNTDKFFQESYDEIDIELAIITTTKCNYPKNKTDQNKFLKTSDKGGALKVLPSDELIDNLIQNADQSKMSTLLQNEGKEVNDDNRKSLVENFFEAYKIYYNQANEKEVEKLTMKEIGETITHNTDITLLYLMYHDLVQKYCNKKGRVAFLTNECNYLEIAKQNVIERPMLTNLTDICFSSSQRLGLEFTEESFQMLEIEQHLIEKRFFNVCSKIPILSFCKICQHFMQKFKQSLAIVDFDQVKLDVDEILSKFSNQTEFQYLIAKGSQNASELNLSQFELKLSESGKSIIWISENELTPELYQIQDAPMSLADLTKECQDYLLNNKTVSFQGRLMKLIDLIGDTDEKYAIPKHVITGKKLFGFLENDSIEIAPLESKPISYYIGRRFKRLRKVKNFENQPQFVIVDDVNNVTETKKDLIIISDTKEQFDEICSRSPLQNVHWFKTHQDHFLWQCSSNSVANLRELMYFDDEEFPLVDFESFPEPVVIIADEPGMGKSTLMTHLEQQVDISSPTLIIRVNLNDHTKKFKDMKNKTLNFDVAKNFLLDTMIKGKHFSNIEWSTFEQHVVKRFFNRGNVILLADGFDEIAPYYIKAVLELLNAVKGHVKKLIITTRSNSAKDKLETSLNVLPISLVPFTKEDVHDFLEMFWKTKIQERDWNQTRFEEFVTALLKEFAKIVNERNFMSIPLHIEMIATCLQETFENYINSGSSDLLSMLRRDLSRCTLYEKFIEIKFTQIYLEQKNAIDLSKPFHEESNYLELFEKTHTRLAFFTIFDEDTVKLLLSKKECSKIKKDIKNIETGKEKRGFITRIVDGKPLFTHLTFAEFFVAKAVWELFVNYPIDPETTQVVVHNLLKTDKIQICRFIQTFALRYSTPLENSPDLIDIFLSMFTRTSSLIFGKLYFEFTLSCFDLLLSVVESCVNNSSDATLKTINLLKNEDKYCLLCVSAKMGYTKLVRILAPQLTAEFLKQRFDKTECDESPVGLATKKQNYKIVMSLVREFGYDVTWPDRVGKSFCIHLLEKNNYDAIRNLLKMGLHELGRPCSNEKHPLIIAIESKETPHDVIEMLLDVTDVKLSNEYFCKDVSNFQLFFYDLSLTKKIIEKGFILKMPNVNFIENKMYLRKTWNYPKSFNIFDRTWIDRMRFLCENGLGFNTTLPKKLEQLYSNLVLIFDPGTLDYYIWREKRLKAMITSEQCFQVALEIDQDEIKLRLNFCHFLKLDRFLDDKALEQIKTFFKEKRLRKITSKAEILQILNLGQVTTEDMYFKELTLNLCLEKYHSSNATLVANNPEILIEKFTILSELTELMTKLETIWQNIMTAIENQDCNKVCTELEGLQDPNLRKTVVNCWDDLYGSPLHFAAYHRNCQMVELLLKSGAYPNSNDRFTRLEKLQLVEHVKKILDDGAATPMHIAAAMGHLEIVKLLHKKGGWINAITWKYKYTPLDVAEAAGHTDVVEYLKEHGAERRSSEWKTWSESGQSEESESKWKYRRLCPIL